LFVSFKKEGKVNIDSQQQMEDFPLIGIE